MLSLLEQQDVSRLIDTLNQYISDDIYDQAETYDITEDPETYIVTVKLFNEAGEELVSVEVDDYDVAVEVLADMFDLDDEDMYDGEADEYYDDDGEYIYDETDDSDIA